MATLPPPPPLRPGASSVGPGTGSATTGGPGLGGLNDGRGLQAEYLLPTATLISFNQAQKLLGAPPLEPANPEVEALVKATRDQVRSRSSRSRSRASGALSRSRRGTPSPALPPLEHHEAQPPTAQAAAGSINISGMFARFDDVRHAETSEAAALQRLSLNDWLSSYHQEMSSYSSISIYAETKLSEAMRMDAAQVPSAFRTAVCADLFYKVCDLFGRYSGLMQTIGDELCRSIYADFPKEGPLVQKPDAPPTTHFDLTPYFNANHKMSERVERLEKEVLELSDTTKFYERESRTRANAIRIAQKPLRLLFLRIYFQEWAKTVQNKSGRMMQIILQWKDAKAQQLMMRCIVQGWKRMVKEGVLSQLQDDYANHQSNSSKESASLREMLQKNQTRLEMEESMGQRKGNAITRILDQFRKPGAVEAMKHRRRDSIVTLKQDIDGIGQLDADLRDTFDTILSAPRALYPHARTLR